MQGVKGGPWGGCCLQGGELDLDAHTGGVKMKVEAARPLGGSQRPGRLELRRGPGEPSRPGPRMQGLSGLVAGSQELSGRLGSGNDRYPGATAGLAVGETASGQVCRVIAALPPCPPGPQRLSLPHCVRRAGSAEGPQAA